LHPAPRRWDPTNPQQLPVGQDGQAVSQSERFGLIMGDVQRSLTNLPQQLVQVFNKLIAEQTIK